MKGRAVARLMGPGVRFAGLELGPFRIKRGPVPPADWTGGGWAGNGSQSAGAQEGGSRPNVARWWAASRTLLVRSERMAENPGTLAKL